MSAARVTYASPLGRGGGYPSTATIARKLGMATGAVERSLAHLAHHGAVRLADGSRPVVVGANLTATT
ncbi:hypothetical protein [Frankia sp. Cr1]|uniref:hypothetical protein n=1 Tax=Frankia sp. Cr1 TaxID=3073931 RepID=UPI002AD2496A|nr:hypothetical protein [Frankia sp. Cr1]